MTLRTKLSWLHGCLCCEFCQYLTMVYILYGYLKCAIDCFLNIKGGKETSTFDRQSNAIKRIIKLS